VDDFVNVLVRRPPHFQHFARRHQQNDRERSSRFERAERIRYRPDRDVSLDPATDSVGSLPQRQLDVESSGELVAIDTDHQTMFSSGQLGFGKFTQRQRFVVKPQIDRLAR
jgi:hypothetical protein